MKVEVTRPLSYAAAGLGLIAVDFRTDLPDLLPDFLGWALVAMGAWALPLRPAALLAGLAAVLSLADFALPYRYVYRHPMTGEVVDDEIGELYRYPVEQRWLHTSDLRALALGGAIAAGGLALWLIIRTLTHRAAGTGDGDAERRLRLLGLVPAVLSVPAVIVVGAGILSADGYDPVWNGNLEYAGLAGTMALGWLAARFVLDRDQPWARHAVPLPR